MVHHPDSREAPISVVERASNGVTVVRLRGEHDLNSRDALTGVLDAQDGDLVVELRECEFIDSTIIGVLLAQARRRENAGARFEVIAATDGTVARILEIVNADAVLTMTWQERVG